MADYQITTCPACQLAFRVSDGQLAAASGLVRCGACFKVFNALDNLDSVPATPADTPGPWSDSPAEPPVRWDADDLYIDDNFDLNLLDRLAGEQGDSRDYAADAPPAAADLPGDEYGEEDDNFVIDDNFDLSRLERSSTRNAPAAQRATAPRDPPQPAISQPPRQDVTTMDRNATANEDLSPAETVPPADTAVDNPGSSAPEEPHAEMDEPEAGVDRDNEADSESEPEQDAIHLAHVPDNLGATLDHADDSPVARRRTPVFVALAVLALALALGYGHFNAATLAADPRLLPALATLCRVSGCQLPNPAATGNVVATQLVVRSHPDQRGLLRLDATLVNTADTPHPLPHLTLRFEDLQGATLMERHFTPAQYLRGRNLSGDNSTLESGGALRVEMDLLDPGPEAVSYSLSTETPAAGQESPHQ